MFVFVVLSVQVNGRRSLIEGGKFIEPKVLEEGFQKGMKRFNRAVQDVEDGDALEMSRADAVCLLALSFVVAARLVQLF